MRKSAATSPPESRSSAAFGIQRGRPAGAGIRRTETPRTAMRVASASGTCAMKIDSQPSASVRIPPAAGPSDAPRTPARTRTWAARASLPVVAARRSSAAMTTSAPPAAWTHRAPTSTSKTGASPHASEEPAKITAPTANAGFGRRRARYAAGMARSASARLYDVRTQATVVTSTSNWPRMSGSARVTTEESASASPIASPSSAARMRGV